MNELIDHIAFLVSDLEEARDRWTAALGYEFSPIARYRTDRYSDATEPQLHHHETRISMSRQGPPYIELMSVTGRGTHGPAQLGVHHLGLRVPDVEARIQRCAALGIRDDGVVSLDDGRVCLWFTDKRDFYGIRLEFISPVGGPVFADDGSQLWVDPNTGRKSLWGPPAADAHND